MKLIRPEWAPAARVSAVQTTRTGGVSRGPWASFNLGRANEDAAADVYENRCRLAACLPADPCWLEQVHGTDVVHLADWKPGLAADAAWTDRPAQVAAILTADCLPVLLATAAEAANQGEPIVVAAIHAGWRGLVGGVIEQTVTRLPLAPRGLVAWIGPGISAAHYEVGEEVRDAFVELDPVLADAFVPGRSGRSQADLKKIAWRRLRAAGVGIIQDAGLCTFAETGRFYSWRRDAGRTGRQATLIWIDEED